MRSSLSFLQRIPEAVVKNSLGSEARLKPGLQSPGCVSLSKSPNVSEFLVSSFVKQQKHCSHRVAVIISKGKPGSRPQLDCLLGLVSH